MAIVSSTFVLDAHAQANGSHWCKEIHTDSEGRVQHIMYRLPAGQGTTEATANMNARVAYLNEQLAIAEAEAIFNGA